MMLHQLKIQLIIITQCIMNANHKKNLPFARVIFHVDQFQANYILLHVSNWHSIEKFLNFQIVQLSASNKIIQFFF